MNELVQHTISTDPALRFDEEACVQTYISRDEAYAHGKAARKRLSRPAQGHFVPFDRDPVAILEAQHQTRLPGLVPIRVGRMLESPFAFYRGAGAIMAHDVGRLPHSGNPVVICGDAHIGNFGLFATPERRQVFELNDFDEASTAPWEWDVKRFATSVRLAALDAGLHKRRADRETRHAVRAYRTSLASLLELSVLDRYYHQGNARWLARMLDSKTYLLMRDAARKARRRTSDDALERLATSGTDGSLRIVDQWPIMMHSDVMSLDAARALMGDYLASLRTDIALLMSGFTLVDVAIRVVGVGSVGTHCYIMLFTGPSGEPLFLQVKEAQRSVLERYGGMPEFLRNIVVRSETCEGYRVATAQQILQSSADPFLGYFRYDGRDFYVRQFRDMKGSVDAGSLPRKRFGKYAKLCGSLLARAHAQNRSAAFIGGYMGSSAVFDRAIATWAIAYQQQVERDFTDFEAAVVSGRLPAQLGV